MIKFKFEGKDAELDDKTNLLYLDGKIIDPVFVGQEFVAKVNKAIRDTMPKTRKLNIGCGHRPKNDFINLDYDHLVYPDIVRDINEGLPFDSDSIDEIYCSHVIEHIKDIFFFMYEM